MVGAAIVPSCWLCHLVNEASGCLCEDCIIYFMSLPRWQLGPIEATVLGPSPVASVDIRRFNMKSVEVKFCLFLNNYFCAILRNGIHLIVLVNVCCALIMVDLNVNVFQCRCK